jgi:hypothetical protein
LQKGARFEWVFHTKQPKFDIQDYQKVASFKFEPTKKVWMLYSKNKSAKEFHGTLPSLFFKADSKSKNSKIAFQLNYLQQISSEKSVPKALLFGY